MVTRRLLIKVASVDMCEDFILSNKESIDPATIYYMHIT